MDTSLIRHLDFEISSICNAGCTVCSRRPFGQFAKFEHTYWSIEDVKETIDVEIISQLDRLTFCGNFGDPMGNPDIVKIVKYFKEINEKIAITINTNGGIGDSNDYEELGKLEVSIMFGLDGINEKNELYRVNVKWDNVVENVTAFAKNCSEKCLFVQFLMWSETTDQIIPMIEFIQSIGKGSLLLKKPFSHGDKTPVFNMKSEITHFLTPIYDEEYNKFFDTTWNFDRLETLKKLLPNKKVKELEIGNFRKIEGIIQTDKKYEKTDVVFNEYQINQFINIKKQTCYSKSFYDPSDINSNVYSVFITYNKMIMPCCIIPPNISTSMFHANGLETDYQKEILNKMVDLGFENFSLKGKKLKSVLETNILDKFVYDEMGSGNEFKVCKLSCGKC